MILQNQDNGVYSIRFNRPDSLNAFTPEMLHALMDALNAAEADEQTRVVVLSGAGRAFSAGVDLKVLQGIEPRAGKIGDVFDQVATSITRKIRNHRVPIIAKVHGACFTGALEIALSCDFILADSQVKFGDTHAQWGLRPTWGMAQNLARAVGVRRARQLSYSAAVFRGADALQWGLVNELAESEEALDVLSAELSRKICEGSLGAISAYKDLYRLAEQQLDIDSALEQENLRSYPGIDDTQDRLSGFAST